MGSMPPLLYGYVTYVIPDPPVNVSHVRVYVTVSV